MFVVYLNTVSLFANCDHFNIMNFDGILITGSVRHIQLGLDLTPTPTPGVGAGAGVGTDTDTDTGTGTSAGATDAQTNSTQIIAAIAAIAVAVTANAANTTLIVNQPAVATAIAATLPTKSNINSLSPNAMIRHKNHMDPTYLMISYDMQLF